MIRPTYRLALLASFVALTSCASLERQKHFSFSVHSDTEACGRDVHVEDLLKDKEFADYADLIKSVAVKDARVKITNPKAADNSAATSAHGKVFIGANADSATVELSTYADVPLQQDATQELKLTPEATAKLAELVKNAPHQFTVVSEGCADKAPAYFNFDIELTLALDAGL